MRVSFGAARQLVGLLHKNPHPNPPPGEGEEDPGFDICSPPPGGRPGGGLNTPPRGFGYGGSPDENERKTRESPVILQPETPTPTLPQGIGANPNRWRFK